MRAWVVLALVLAAPTTEAARFIATPFLDAAEADLRDISEERETRARLVARFTLSEPSEGGACSLSDDPAARGARFNVTVLVEAPSDLEARVSPRPLDVIVSCEAYDVEARILAKLAPGSPSGTGTFSLRVPEREIPCGKGCVVEMRPLTLAVPYRTIPKAASAEITRAGAPESAEAPAVPFLAALAAVLVAAACRGLRRP